MLKWSGCRVRQKKQGQSAVVQGAEPSSELAGKQHDGGGSLAEGAVVAREAPLSREMARRSTARVRGLNPVECIMMDHTGEGPRCQAGRRREEGDCCLLTLPCKNGKWFQDVMLFQV